ncbi:hypothetical protein [Rhizobium bangladeshense]|uniref:hypothetical protein n=1 Tax=Rhizobium bangladeshense TaxID=1138189 RepID=UPI0007E566B8|nr:hypothetical protein [Rhizobium bangladeshense]
MARFLEILMRLRKFITKWKQNSADPAESSAKADHFSSFFRYFLMRWQMAIRQANRTHKVVFSFRINRWFGQWQ